MTAHDAWIAHFTPARRPESNGVWEAFVKTFSRELEARPALVQGLR